MNKIYYNNQGWICKRHPYNLPIENENQFVEVTDEDYKETLHCQEHFAWRLVNGQLVQEQYEQPTEEEIKENLREQREYECFPIINRGQLWYSRLTSTQISELNIWYQAWLDVTITKIVPLKPAAINTKKIEHKEVILCAFLLFS